MNQPNRIQWIYSSRNNQELAERYDVWAKDYDSDLEGDFQYQSPKHAAEVFARYVPKEARIMDAGAGTGLVGELLAQAGYHNLVAMDMSQGMLEEARKKGLYREYLQMVMGDPLDIPTNTFDGVISTGTLTVGHAPASSLDELARITRPGGYIVYTLRPDLYETGGFKEQHSALESEGRWRLVEVTDNFQALPRGEPDVLSQVWVYQVTG